MTLPACRTSTIQPQPPLPGNPSTLHVLRPLWSSSHLTTDTTPLAAAWITVYRPTMRSTPWCVGRDGVRKPEPTDAPSTGRVQPDAAILPAVDRHVIATESPTARAAPCASALTISVARPSCLAYAPG